MTDDDKDIRPFLPPVGKRLTLPGWCSTCQNTGWVNCYCGGDNCICENNGEYPCPECDGDTISDCGYEDD